MWKSPEQLARESQELYVLLEQEIDRQILEQREAWRSVGYPGDGVYECRIFPDLPLDVIQRIRILYYVNHWTSDYVSRSGRGDYLILRPKPLEARMFAA